MGENFLGSIFPRLFFQLTQLFVAYCIKAFILRIIDCRAEIAECLAGLVAEFYRTGDPDEFCTDRLIDNDFFSWDLASHLWLADRFNYYTAPRRASATRAVQPIARRLPRRGFILQPRVARRRRATLGLRLREDPNPNGVEASGARRASTPLGLGRIRWPDFPG